MQLPKSAQEIASVIGREKALYLIGRLPGWYVGTAGNKSWRPILYVPTARRLTPDHILVSILGWSDAEKLCAAFGGEILQPANCAEVYRKFRDKRIAELLSEGVPPKVVAEWFGITDRRLRTIRREITHEDFKAANDNDAANLMASGKRQYNEP